MKPLTKCFLAIVCLSLLFSQQSQAQELQQTIRGTVIDGDSKAPLIGASVILINSDPIRGLITDHNGKFRMENVAVGRVSLKITYMGYEERILPNMLLSSARELVLKIELQESLNQIEEVVVNGKKHKAELINEMAVSSSRTFGVEETSRYAGTFNDPARMASNFAGVAMDPGGDNSISIRGNSPAGVKWRLEGVEIPNPNHFADEGATGGPINALNSSMIANSDFMTGAFAPEYGNAYSGVFDVRLRTGNNEKREYIFGASALGFELAAEGPFSKNYNGSYLANYRYSSLAVLDDAGIVDFGGIPKYQDASFKLNLPAGKLGYFNLFGLWGKSWISEAYEEERNGKMKEVFRSDYLSNMGTIGLAHTNTFGDDLFLRSAVSVSTNGSGYNQWVYKDSVGLQNNYNDYTRKHSLRLQSIANYKLSPSNKLQFGAFYTQDFFDLFAELRSNQTDSFNLLQGDRGDAGFAEAFACWKYRPTEQITIVSGLHYNRVIYNGEQVLEPRISGRWNFHGRQYLSLGYGRHSRSNSLLTNLALVQLEDGTTQQLNKSLGMIKAEHFVLGYENRIGALTNFKIEAYYQRLFDVPVQLEESSYSHLNLYDSYMLDQLNNQGTGENYGLEVTVERFFNKGFFYLLTASVYESTYVGSDGVERNTRWNGNYITNLVMGKEWNVGRDGKFRTIGLSGKVLLMGGRRFSPILFEESKQMGYTVRDYSRAYEVKGDDIFQLNTSFYVRRNRAKTTHEFKIDIQNVTNYQANLTGYFNPASQEVVYGKQLGFLPNISYQIQF